MQPWPQRSPLVFRAKDAGKSRKRSPPDRANCLTGKLLKRVQLLSSGLAHGLGNACLACVRFRSLHWHSARRSKVFTKRKFSTEQHLLAHGQFASRRGTQSANGRPRLVLDEVAWCFRCLVHDRNPPIIGRATAWIDAEVWTGIKRNRRTHAIAKVQVAVRMLCRSLLAA
jgi:hypothetical protein